MMYSVHAKQKGSIEDLDFVCVAQTGGFLSPSVFFKRDEAIIC
jgi:hypothetical protein